MIVMPMTKHYLEFLSLKGGCTGSSESTLVKMSHCWKSRVTAHIHIKLILTADWDVSYISGRMRRQAWFTEYVYLITEYTRDM